MLRILPRLVSLTNVVYRKRVILEQEARLYRTKST